MNVDEWDIALSEVEELYGKRLANKINELIEEGKTEDANLILIKLGL